MNIRGDLYERIRGDYRPHEGPRVVVRVVNLIDGEIGLTPCAYGARRVSLYTLRKNYRRLPEQIFRSNGESLPLYYVDDFCRIESRLHDLTRGLDCRYSEPARLDLCLRMAKSLADLAREIANPDE